MTVFAGQRILITGGSSGIGKELARQWIERQAHVTIVADGPERLDATRRELSASTPVETDVCDVGDAASVAAMANRYLARHGAPHVLVNNAGFAVYRAFEEMDLSEVERLIDVNFAGACFVTRAFLDSMIAARRGHIVMMASIAGRLPMTPCGVYSAAKHGMVAWAETLAAEVAHYGIRVHVICPGRVETGFFDHQTFVERTPRREAQRALPVESVARATIEAVERGRFLTYRPRGYAFVVWAAQSAPVLSRPFLQWLMRSRIATLASQKTSDARTPDAG